ncbi:hypothetical protein ONS95_005168 [Cadophora gregata]|uniref:uncharacterized protein n=1 Tax=Cadophora gregata TaxID=51156 RepID=UPI0026DB8154|nr:uncharacterized protein ONS95_005168 [Cadophora gregata]KAK0104903.1 hypothetical protein ONS95_005168 [Cadophora gregata]
MHFAKPWVNVHKAASPRSEHRFGFGSLNSTLNTIQHALPESQSDAVEKRILRIKPADTGRVTRVPTYLALDVSNYLADNLGEGPGGRWDTQYIRQGFFAGDMRTVTRDGQFGAIPFEFGTNGLHGCTMLTIISKRAVWMAHFWEAYAFKDSYDPKKPLKEKNGLMVRSDGDPEDIPNLQSWQDRAIAAVTGQPLSAPLHLPTEGNPIDPNLFNRRDDNTEAIIMTPAETITTGSRGEKMADYRYPNKIGELEMALRQLIPGIKIQRQPYTPLNYFNPVDMAKRDKTEAGMALFQFDPNADGAGARYFRLFHEGKVWLRETA